MIMRISGERPQTKGKHKILRYSKALKDAAQEF